MKVTSQAITSAKPVGIHNGECANFGYAAARPGSTRDQAKIRLSSSPGCRGQAAWATPGHSVPSNVFDALQVPPRSKLRMSCRRHNSKHKLLPRVVHTPGNLAAVLQLLENSNFNTKLRASNITSSKSLSCALE